MNTDGSITRQVSRAQYANGNQPADPTACDLVADALREIVAEGENVSGVTLSAKQISTIWDNFNKAEE